MRVLVACEGLKIGGDGMGDRLTYCDVMATCEDCPRYGDDCDGDKMVEHTDYISRADAIEAVMAEGRKVYTSECASAERIIYEEDAVEALAMLPSADAVPQSEQYKKGFEDAKRAYEIELARSTDAVQGEWIPCSERLPLVGGEFLVTLVDKDGAWVSTAQWNMTFGGRWQDIFPNDGYRDISNVIAWKTLPIPYREDGEA